MASSLLGCVALAVVGLPDPAAAAPTVTGTIRTMHVNLETNMAHIYLTGSPTFDWGTCSAGRWTGNSLDDDKFMQHVWPLLAMAKSRGLTVTVTVRGCVNGYPRIDWIDVEPRE